MNEQAKKISWKCRRGSLELDLILANFFQQQYPHLSADQQQNFDQLLDEPDPLLTTWILGNELPSHQGYALLIELLKQSLLTTQR